MSDDDGTPGLALGELRGLLEAATLVRDERDLVAAFDRIAGVIGRTLGFGVVVTNLYRRAWDDYVVITVYGDPEARETLLGCTYERGFFEPVLTEQFDCEGAYVVTQGSYDWSAHHPGVRFVPEGDAAAPDERWHREDEIFVPFHSSSGELLGVFCVGEPVSGRRPTREELRTLVAVVDQAGIAVEAAQMAAAANRQRRALEHLLHVSSSLTNTSTDEPPLQLVADAIHDALGFEHVFVDLVDENGRLVPRASAGWDADSPLAAHSFARDAFVDLFLPEFEIEGCYLVPDTEATRIVEPEAQVYSSEMNGRGPHAWHDHWLLVPLYGRYGKLIGFIWPDDPGDRLIPTRETLQALRMFANQAAAAIEAANDIATIRDISKTRARLLSQEREQVARLQELDALKDEFVALVSHELRTPLTSIRGYSELLRQDVQDPQQQEFLAVIDRNAQRLIDIVNELLLIAQIESGQLVLERRELPLAGIVEDAVASGRVGAAAKRIELTAAADHALRVLADPGRLGQVVDNLVSNAVKFTPDGGRITIACRQDGDDALVEVADTGIGIPADEAERLFTRFFRTSNARLAHIPGTGLGLSISRAIAEAHGGTLSFESVEGSGTTFRLRIPLALVPAGLAA